MQHKVATHEGSKSQFERILNDNGVPPGFKFPESKSFFRRMPKRFGSWLRANDASEFQRQYKQWLKNYKPQENETKVLARVA